MGNTRVTHWLRGFAAIATILICSLELTACGSSGNTVTAPSTLSKCAVTVAGPGNTVPANGGGGTINIQTERECQWTAQPEVSWLSISGGASGQGPGAVQFAAAANADPTSRTGGVMINGQRAQVSQAAGECRFELSSNATALPRSGGSGSVDVRASSAQCTWTAASSVEWISIDSNANGKGSVPVTFTVAATTGPPRTGTLTIAGQHFSVTQAEGCSYAVSPMTYSVPPSGGTQAVTITASAGCPWTAASNADWISIVTATGTGSGIVAVTVAGTNGPARTGTATIAGQVFTVTQSPGCTIEVSPLSFNVEAGGGARTINVIAGSGCAWSASANQPWVTIAAGSSGSGSGTVTINVAADNGPSRSGSITVAGQTVTITQGEGCTFAIAPDSQSVASSGGTGSVTVTAGAGCAWTATSGQPWITITSGSSGNGNGTVNFTVASTNGPSRSGTMSIAGHTFTINQGQGCSFSLATTSASAPAGGASGNFDVRTADGCGWAANSNANWLSITAGATGSGNGTVRYTAAANTGPQRSGTITAGGQTFTVNQSAGCTYSISPTNQNVASGGGPVSVGVTTPSGCAWTAVSNVPWLGISSGGSGSGNGTVQISVAANADAERNGTATIAGQTYTVVQASGCTFALSSTTQAIPAAGGGASFNVNTSASCAWTAVANAPWISVTSGASGNGPGSVQFTAGPNSGGARNGTITAAGQTFTVTQDSGCSAVVTPDVLAAPAAGGPQNVSISTAAECSWTAASNAPWIAIGTAGSGSGNATVRLDIQANTDAARSGTATIAGKVVTVNQDTGCTISISPTSTPMVVGGGAGSPITVTAGAGCAWTAVSGAAWIIVTSGASGAGPGTVTFSVDANVSGTTRSGSITIGGQLFTVNQAGQ